MALAATPTEEAGLIVLHTKLGSLLTTTDPSQYQLPGTLQGPNLRREIYAMLACDAPDFGLLRFLRANKLDTDLAFKQYLSHLRWRTQDMHVAEILAEGDVGAALTENRSSASPAKTKSEKEELADAQGFLKQLRLGKSYVRGTDREGRPAVWIRVRLHRGGDQTVKSLERYATWNIETVRLMFKEGVSSALLVFDMTGFGLANLDYTPLKFILTTLTYYYPLGLGNVIIHNPPRMMAVLWRVVIAWGVIPAHFMEHIHFTKSVLEIEKLVEKKYIPKEIGGDDDWVFEYDEVDVEAAKRDGYPGRFEEGQEKDKERLWNERLAIAERFEKATQEWIDATNAQNATNSETPADTENKNIANIKAERQKISQELVKSYWQLDPLIRSRSIYDRWGWIKSPAQE